MTEAARPLPARHRTASVIVLTLDVIAMLSLLVCFTLIAHRFCHIFDDLLEGRALPELTRLVLAIPNTVSVLCFVGAIAALIYKESRIANKTRTLVMNIAVFVAAVFVFIFFAFAMFMPLESFIGILE